MKDKIQTTRVEFVHFDASNEGNLWQFSTIQLKTSMRVLLINVSTGKSEFEAKLIPNKESFGGIKVEVLKTNKENALRLTLLQWFSKLPRIKISKLYLEKGII